MTTLSPSQRGWSEAYGLFLEGEADMVLSYTTSPAYHLIAEGDDGKAAALFSDGHYMQIEVAAKVASTDQPELADMFMAFVASEAFQSVIPTTNWMYPAVRLKDGLPDGFETLIEPEIALSFESGEARDMRDAAIEEWLNASLKLDWKLDRATIAGALTPNAGFGADNWHAANRRPARRNWQRFWRGRLGGVTIYLGPGLPVGAD